jgi:hypothetical protein
MINKVNSFASVVSSRISLVTKICLIYLYQEFQICRNNHKSNNKLALASMLLDQLHQNTYVFKKLFKILEAIGLLQYLANQQFEDVQILPGVNPAV